jgi:hypothetical protein
MSIIRNGKEIKILRTDASLWKEHKTLSFTPSSPFYDTVYTEGTPSFLLMLKPTTVNAIQEACKRSVIVFLSRKATATINVSSLHLKNAVFLEELTAMYPHMGSPWDGTVEDAVTLVAILVGHRRIFGSWNARAETYGLSKAPEPFRLWWICLEGQKCLSAQQKHKDSKLIDKVIALDESSTYADVIQKAATFPPDVVVGFATADISIDDKSWRTLWDLNLENKFLALLRYDVPASGRVEDAILDPVPRSDIQDTWVIRVKDILDRGADTIANTTQIPFGQQGAAPAIALEMLKHRFTVVNPALSMKTWCSGKESSSSSGYVDRAVYHYVHPTGIHDLQPLLTIPKSLIVRCIQPTTIERPIEGAGAIQWLSAFNKQATAHAEPLKLANSNPFTPSPEDVLRLTNCFQTSGGLAFDKDKMYIGKSPVSQAMWADSTMSAMTPTIASDKSIIVPWPAGADTSREIFVLQYLSKVLRIMPQDEIWEFFCPEKNEIVEAMEAFRWDTAHLPVIKHEKDLVVWSKEALLMLPTTACTHVEDIAVLRNKLRGWNPSITTTDRLRIVIVEDGIVLDDTLVRKLEDVLEKAFEVRVVYPKRTTIHRMTYVMAGAWGVICTGAMESCGWNWILPHGSFVFEVPGQVPGQTGDICLTLSSAAGLQHRFCEKGEKQEEKIFEEVWKEENH